ncbi:hypothetical protein GCM10017668_66890 [Streptomyces tuirus]|uniref:Uncharacterized protein n=1 Tax=Streptomyces tuirus TaxID=68278 RepID=A0A7G1NTD5_9ACTN|nr:hypothetical protein GCM10017668_66890 [Streptomyces tuirus]
MRVWSLSRIRRSWMGGAPYRMALVTSAAGAVRARHSSAVAWSTSRARSSTSPSVERETTEPSGSWSSVASNGRPPTPSGGPALMGISRADPSGSTRAGAGCPAAAISAGV